MPDRFRPAGEARMSVLCPAREPCARGACRHQARSSSPAPEGARCGRSGLTPAARRHQPAATRIPTTTVQPPARRPRPVTGPIQHAPLTAGSPLVQEQRLQVEVTWAFSECTVTIVASRSTVTSPPSEPGATSPRGSSSALAATECASTSSVLRPLPVANTRTCADSFGGTSSTTSPSWTRRCARCRPMPLQPSTAQMRSANLRPAASICAYPAVSVPYLPAANTLTWSSMTSIVAERLCGSIPMITPTISSSGDPEDFRRGGHCYFELGKPLSSLPSHGARREAGHERATPETTTGSRDVGASRQAPGPSLAGPDPASKSLSSRIAVVIPAMTPTAGVHQTEAFRAWIKRAETASTRLTRGRGLVSWTIRQGDSRLEQLVSVMLTGPVSPLS